jgi:hypothetical protein
MAQAHSNAPADCLGILSPELLAGFFPIFRGKVHLSQDCQAELKTQIISPKRLSGRHFWEIEQKLSVHRSFQTSSLERFNGVSASWLKGLEIRAMNLLARRGHQNER